MSELAFWLLLLAAAVYFFGGCGRGVLRGGGCHGPRWSESKPPSPPGEPGETPKQILDRRLAKGEITLDEYRRVVEELNRQG